MKAAELVEYGGEAAIQFNSDAPKPEHKDNEVLVEVSAAGVNPFDYAMRGGTYKESIPLELPAVLGGDVAGIVSAIGENVTGFEIGQAVYGMANAVGGHGSFAEFTPVKATQLIPKPKTANFITAAALPLAGVSAYQALIDHIGLMTGQKILIHGGAGGIGSLAIQIAHMIGATVATTVTGSDTDFVKGLGADIVIDYRTQDFTEMIKDYDAVFDTVGGETNAKSYTVLKPGGALVSMVVPPDEARAEQFKITYIHQSSKPTVERLTKISDLVDSGKLSVNIDKVFPLEQAGNALEYLKTNHPKGKVVIDINV